MTLPKTLKATDIKWLSVWCRAFQVNFGDLTFPEDLSFEDNSLDSAVLTGPSDDHDHEDEEGADAEGDKLDDLPPPLLGKFKWYFVKYLAHVIEQPNFRIPNPQYLQRNF